MSPQPALSPIWMLPEQINETHRRGPDAQGGED